MSSIKFAAYPFESASATIVAATSEATGGDCENCLTLDGLTLGKFWVGAAGATEMYLDLTFATAQAFDFAIAAGCKMSGGTYPSIAVRRGLHTVSPAPTPEATLAACTPCDLMFDVLHDRSTTSTQWSVRVAYAIGATDNLIVPFFALGRWDLDCEKYLISGRPAQLRRTATQRIGTPQGAQFVREQKIAHGISVHVHGQIDDPDAEDLRDVLTDAGLARPILYCHAHPESVAEHAAKPHLEHLATILGGLDALPEPGTDSGSTMHDYTFSLLEIIA